MLKLDIISNNLRMLGCFARVSPAGDVEML